jgi:hypothetical protein
MSVEDQIQEKRLAITGGTGKFRISHVEFPALKLRAGTWLQMRSLFDAPDWEVEFAAALHGKSIFVTLPGSVEKGRSLQVGDRYLVRGFNGTCEFSFSSQILHVEKSQFSLAHLAYPDSVESRLVREVPRVTVAIPVVVNAGGEDRRLVGTMRDLSDAGAMIELDVQPGNVGDQVNISFATLFNGREVSVNIPAVIRHVHELDADGHIKSGFEFCNVAQNDKLILYYLLFAFSRVE